MSLRIPALTALATALAALTLPAADAKPDPAAAARTLQPFLDDQTVLVARLDLDRLQADDVVNRLARLAGTNDPGLAEARRVAQEFVATFHQAGIHELYAVFSLADLPHPGPFVVVPLAAGADADRVSETLKQLGTQTVQRTDGAVFAGGRAAFERVTRERLRGQKREPRPGLEPALAAVAGAAAQVLVVPTDDQRRVAAAMLPQLPPQLGGGPGAVLARGVRWAALGLDTQPKLGLKLVVQSEDAPAAQALAQAAEKGLTWAARQPEAKRFLPNIEELVPALTPKVSGDRLTLTLDEAAPAVVKAVAALVERARATAGRSQAQNNLKQIALAFHNYHDAYGKFPADITDKDGKPLLSWRVAILPFLEQDNLYKQFKMDEPWDSEHNKKLIAQMPKTYRSPAQKAGDGKTTYLAPVGQTGEGGKVKYGVLGARIADITDGTSNTIMVVEVNDDAAAAWTKPDDLKVDAKQPLKGLIGHYPEGFNAGFADGSVRFIRRAIDPNVLNHLFTRNGGEVIPGDF